MGKVLTAFLLFLLGMAITLAISLLGALVFTWLWDANVRPAWHVSFIEMYLFMVIIGSACSVSTVSSGSK